jgi:hypothetical protein
MLGQGGHRTKVLSTRVDDVALNTIRNELVNQFGDAITVANSIRTPRR